MIFALVPVIAVAALLAVLLVKTRSDLQSQLDSARADTTRLKDELASSTAEQATLQDKIDWLTTANTRFVDEAERQRQRADDLAARLEAAEAEVETAKVMAEAEAEAARAMAEAEVATAEEQAGPADGDADAAGGGGGDGTEAGLWELLLAHVTRRWAAVVGVPPDNRSIVEGEPSEQLAQALARETERLREEVGVDVELTNPGAAPGGGAGDATARVAVLVAVLELLGVLATSAQRVTVDMGDALVITGDGWVDPYGELAAAYDRVAAAGVALDPLDVGDEQVRLVVHHTAG